MPYYRRNLYVLTVTIFLAALSWNQVIPFLSLFLKELGVKSQHLVVQWTSIVFACQAITSIIGQPYWGKMGDKYGRKPMVIRAGVFLAFIYYGMSFCKAPWQLAVFRLLNGALTGFIPGSITLIATNTPQQLAPRFVAWAQAAAAAGLIAGPTAGQFLASINGYRFSMIISGTAVLISTLLVWWLVKEPNKPECKEQSSLWQDFAISLKSPVMSAVMFAYMSQSIFGAAISPFLALYLAGMKSNIVGLIFALPAVAFVLSARMWTAFGEAYGFPRAIILGFTGTALSSIGLFFVKEQWSFALLYFIAGVFVASLSPASAALICTRINEDFRGRAYGMQNASGTFGALIAPIVAGQIASILGIKAIFFLIAILFLAGPFIFQSILNNSRKTTHIEISAP